MRADAVALRVGERLGVMADAEALITPHETTERACSDSKEGLV